MKSTTPLAISEKTYLQIFKKVGAPTNLLFLKKKLAIMYSLW
jgi:hypothetical protein